MCGPPNSTKPACVMSDVGGRPGIERHAELEQDQARVQVGLIERVDVDVLAEVAEAPDVARGRVERVAAAGAAPFWIASQLAKSVM